MVWGRPKDSIADVLFGRKAIDNYANNRVLSSMK